jgi:hypothetical protein
MSTSTCKPFWGSLVLAGFVGHATVGLAQVDDSASALALFEEGRRLAKENDFAAACPKFEAAARMHRSPGVLLNLADCYEHTNRTASAWATFDEAGSAANRMNLARERLEAQRRKEALEPRLCRLLIHVDRSADGETIQRDGEALDRAAWAAAIPVNPGEHRVLVEAPGRVSWENTVTVADEGRIVVVDVPDLVLSPSAWRAAPPERAPSVARDPTPGWSWTPWRVGEAASMGVGAVAMATGAGLLFGAKGLENHAEGETGTARYDDSGRAVSEANVASGLIIGGAALALAGFVLWLAHPGDTTRGTAHARALPLEGAK